MTHAENIVINHALKLSSLERAAVIEKLLVSLDQPDSDVDSIWAKEADARVEAYKRGEIEAIPAEEVLAKHSRSHTTPPNGLREKFRQWKMDLSVT